MDEFEFMVRSMLDTIMVNIKRRIRKHDNPPYANQFYRSLFQNRMDELKRYNNKD